MSEDKEPDWLAVLAVGGEAMQRKVWDDAVFASGWLDLWQVGRPSRSPWKYASHEPVSIWESGAVNILLRLLGEEELRVLVLKSATEFTLRAAAQVTEMVKAAEAAASTVANQDSGVAELNQRRILALLLLAVVTFKLFVVQGETRAAVDHYLTVITFVLPIALFIWKHK